MSRTPAIVTNSPVHARLRVLEDFVLHYAHRLTLEHPAYLDQEPTPLAAFEDGVVLTPRGPNKRLSRRVAPPHRDDITLHLCRGTNNQPLEVCDLSLGGAKVSWAIGRVAITPGERFSAWIRVLGKPYLRVGLEVMGARPSQLGGLALGLQYRDLTGEDEEWIARLVAACIAVQEVLLAA